MVKKGGKEGSWGRKQYRGAFLVMLAVLGCVGAYFLYSYLTPSAVAPEATTTTTTAADSITFNVSNYCTGDAEGVTITRYRDKHAGLDSGDIQDLRHSDFAVETTGDADMDFEPNADYNYWFQINKTGFLTEWYYFYTSGSPATDMGFSLSLGTNYIYLMNVTEAGHLMAYNSTLGTNFATYNSTSGSFVPLFACTDQDWTLVTKMDYDEAGSDVKAAEGLKKVYDFENNWWNRTVFKIEYNETADRTWARINDWTNYESVSGNSTYIGIDFSLTGTNSFELHFDSKVGSTYAVKSISLCYGYYAGTPVTYTTQDAATVA